MRILVIGNFFQNHNKDKALSSEELCIREYEIFCQEVRSAFNLEDWAQELSTLSLSTLIISASFLPEMPEMDSLVLLCSGLLGITLTMLIYFLYWFMQTKVKTEAEKIGAKLKGQENDACAK